MKITQKIKHNTRGVVYLLRHGAVTSSENKRYIGHTDIPLNQLGYNQAEKWGVFFSDINIERIYCSDLVRSSDTAKIIGAPSNIKPVVQTELREINLGQWEGLYFHEVKTKYAKQFDERGKDLACYRPPMGESFEDLQQRVCDWFLDILKHGQDNIIVVGHAGVNRVLLCHLLGMPLKCLFMIGQDYAGLSVINRQNGGYSIDLLNLVL